MTLRVLFRPDAEAELAEAVDWYEARARGLGAAFLEALDATIDNIRRHPRMYPIVFGGARRAVMRRFPYVVVYVEDSDAIVVLACFHVRRDPSQLRDRD